MSYDLKALSLRDKASVLNAMADNIISAQEAYESMRESYDYACVKKNVEDHYDMGEVTGLKVISGGYTNRSYAVTFDSGKCAFLRQYVPEKEEKEILYEQGLLLHIRKNGFDISAVPYATKEGSYYFRGPAGGEERFFSLSEFLPGEDKYTWEYNDVTETACASAAEATARLHLAANDFNPPASWGGNEPVIRRQLEYFASDMRKYTDIIAQNPDCRSFADYLYSKLDYLENVIGRILKIFEYDVRFIKTVIHTDLHPGNFKYSDEKAVAVFDYDWPKTDVRLYDTAISAMYFSSSWHIGRNGELNIPVMKTFINTYDSTLGKLNGALPPMNETERYYLPEMMMAGSLYAAHYCIDKAANEEGTDIFRFFYFVIHQVNCVEWIDSHLEEVREACRR